MKSWDELKYWQSGEWQVVQERLDDLDFNLVRYNPTRANLFRALELCPFDQVKVCILGQDPYPNPADACGLAFSSPTRGVLPPSLANLLREYASDYGLPVPKSGKLDKWAKQGVLLWNAIPTCTTWKSMSHDWPEWECLTKEILESLSQETGCVFVSLGRFAQGYVNKYVKETDSTCLYFTHPSPRAGISARTPFNGCRLFSSVNTAVTKMGMKPIEWQL